MYPERRRHHGRAGRSSATGSRARCGRGTSPGVLTVVAKLFHIVAPDVAFFGEKDYQQLVLVKKMVRDLDFPVSVVGVPTVREPDGLALSSPQRLPVRRRPTPRHRAAAGAGRGGRGVGARSAGRAGRRRAVLAEEPALQVDYLELRDPELGPEPGVGRARLLVAARLGGTRLIDNVAVQLQPPDEPRPAPPRRCEPGRAALRGRRQHPDRAGALCAPTSPTGRRRRCRGGPAARARLADAHRPADDRRRAGGRVAGTARRVRRRGHRHRRAVDRAEPAARAAAAGRAPRRCRPWSWAGRAHRRAAARGQPAGGRAPTA